MKIRLGFNIGFAFLVFVLGMALYREFDVEQFAFRKKVLGFLYLAVFLVSVFLMLKPKNPAAGQGPEQGA